MVAGPQRPPTCALTDFSGTAKTLLGWSRELGLERRIPGTGWCSDPILACTYGKPAQTFHSRLGANVPADLDALKLTEANGVEQTVLTQVIHY